MSVTTTPLTAKIGTEIDGMAGSDLVDPWVARECLALLNRYGVLVYREADISDADLVKFSRLLGDVVLNPTGEHEYREIATITLDPTKTNAVLASYRQGNFLWHIDGATDALPQKTTLLTAREVDEEGGDTEFASTYAAYEALTESEKAEIAEVCVLHSFSAAQRRAHPDASDAKQEQWRRVPTRVHPLVWTHRDGRKSLLLGATAAEVVGWSGGERHGAARSTPRLVDPESLCSPASLAARRPGHLGQHGHAPSSVAVRTHVTASHAPHHSCGSRARCLDRAG